MGGLLLWLYLDVVVRGAAEAAIFKEEKEGETSRYFDDN